VNSMLDAKIKLVWTCCAAKKYDRTVTARSRFAVQGYVSNAFKELTGRLLDIKLLR